MKTMRLLLLPFALLFTSCATHSRSEYVGVIAESRGVLPNGEIRLQGDGNDRATTPLSFEPPVEIKIVAKTDSTNLRIGYAADQVIFNWELDPHQLRVDGGPADGRHRAGAGLIPVNEFVTIKWVVTAEQQVISVNGKQRFSHRGDYTHIFKPVTVFGGANSHVTVKSIKVRQIQ
jgi:hypothetical protein